MKEERRRTALVILSLDSPLNPKPPKSPQGDFLNPANKDEMALDIFFIQKHNLKLLPILSFLSCCSPQGRSGGASYINGVPSKVTPRKIVFAFSTADAGSGE